MELNSTLESVDALAAASPSSSQPQSQEIFINGSRARRQQLTLAQMRGVIQIFNHYFPKNARRRMSKDEQNRKWSSYKNRIYAEYGRVISGKLSSEKALVKRYSQPLEFLKYKLKRATNLKVDDLSPANKQYYYEIGGLDDVAELIKLTYNMDSVQKMSNNFRNYNNQRKRRRVDIQNSDNRNQNDDNRNHNVVIDRDERKQDIMNDDSINITSNIPIPPKLENDDKLTEALTIVQDKMDIFEREQLDKKKIEMFEITKQKLLAINQSVETHFMNYPHLIGCLPNIADQNSLAFDCWMNKYKHIILKDAAIKKDLDLFIEQLIILKMDQNDWKTFLTKWKMNRMFHNDNFHIVWRKIKNELGIIGSIDLQNDKEEKDDDDEDDDEDVLANE